MQIRNKIRALVRNMKLWVHEIFFILLFLQNEQLFIVSCNNALKFAKKIWKLGPKISKSMGAEIPTTPILTWTLGMKGFNLNSRAIHFFLKR